MASGHVNRSKRPNTWLHRPQACDVKILLANSEPSTHGPERRSLRRSGMSEVEGQADITQASDFGRN